MPAESSRQERHAGDARQGERSEQPERSARPERPERSARPERPERSRQEERSSGLPHGPEAAFDALYIRSAGPLLRQVELLTGDPVFSRHTVLHAFGQAWQRWPEVARDSDPVGWVRAAAYEYALAPWQRWLPGAGHRPQPRKPEEPLEAALLDLPPAYRRVVLLYDGLGLDLPEAAAEVEASTVAAAARITHAREALAAAVPEPGEPLSERLGALLDGEPEPPRSPAAVRDAGERGARQRTLGAYALTGLIAVVTLGVVLLGPGTGSRTAPVDEPAGRSTPAATPHHANGAGPFSFGERTRAVKR
ncbi:sigma factor-like helix-turn-helix DNA-binding protein [Actinacidiphila acidipaludis]|uniref:sigma factor-like helix-turn-helix DNA-binding protein n=1 Tax=Actinacidiphila acidipaludis TaxID=2873382 RepID=UPI0027DF19C7|nr:sigma factor-like helix-turn-helix DNA-binding protein [Streptomyces acidipaludis]